MNEIVIRSPAKINLSLSILDKRDDGYHNLKTHFQLVDIYDHLKFKSDIKGKIRIKSTEIYLNDEDNTIYNAAKKLLDYRNSNDGIEIEVKKNLICIMVDTGLMRKNEFEYTYKLFKKKYNLNVKLIDASKIFFKKLKKISNPEKKRKIIGSLFVKVFEREAKKYKNVKFLAQGTLYPDIIESKSSTGSKTSKIKSHHNVGGLPKKMNLKLVEPLKDFFKDEVRVLGTSLGLVKDINYKHPFPGPGLGIRIVGNITIDRIKILQEVDDIYIKELIKSGLYNKIWQAYAALLPIKTVGVMGDSRTYENICLLRAVKSEDGMTADYFNFPKNFMDNISNKIINNVKGINRVVYDITSKPPSTIELE